MSRARFFTARAAPAVRKRLRPTLGVWVRVLCWSRRLCATPDRFPVNSYRILRPSWWPSPVAKVPDRALLGETRGRSPTNVRRKARLYGGYELEVIWNPTVRSGIALPRVVAIRCFIPVSLLAQRLAPVPSQEVENKNSRNNGHFATSASALPSMASRRSHPLGLYLGSTAHGGADDGGARRRHARSIRLARTQDAHSGGANRCGGLPHRRARRAHSAQGRRAVADALTAAHGLTATRGHRTTKVPCLKRSRW